MFSRVEKLLKITKNNVQLLRPFWNASVSTSDQAIILKHETSGETLLFPSVWMRDNCQCSACFNQTLYSRTIPLTEFHASVLPKSISCKSCTSGDVHLEIKWPDRHQSTFNLSWLREHSFDEKNQSTWLTNNYLFADKVTWKASNFKDILRYFSFDKIMNSDLELFKWLFTLNTHGLAIIRGMGTERTQIEQLTTRIGYSKRTTYGPLYVVEAKENTTNSAYLAAPLSLHVDLPYFEYIPSVNMLHFAIQSPKEDEGVNQLVDGLGICEQLKRYDVNMYNTLVRTIVEWTDKGRDSVEEFHHVHRAPVICENSTGQVTRINVSQPQRDPQFCVSLQEANQWYEAMNWFLHLAHNPKNMIEHKMEQGDLLSFDNTRVLHGRSGFTTQRSVIGAYMDWDVINSKLRILFSKLGLKSTNDIEW